MGSGTSRSLLVLAALVAAPSGLSAQGGGGNAAAENKPDKQNAEGPADGGLAVEVSAGAVATGRDAAVVKVSGAPRPPRVELKRRPQLPSIDCEGAAVLPATWSRAPAVLVPASERALTIECIARHRDAEARFSVAAREPDPGLYAAASEPTSTTTAGSVSLRAFVVNDDKSTSPPQGLRAASNIGSTKVGQDGIITVEIPKGKAPKMLVVALAAGERTGLALVPLIGKTRLKVEAERRARVRVRIAGRWFGPARARRGVAKLRIEVPPGVVAGVARSVSRRGYELESVANLKTPSWPRLAVLSPPVVGAGGRVRLVVAAVDRAGRPAPRDQALRVKSKRGSVGSVRAVADGLWHVEYTAPSRPGSDRLRVSIGKRKRGGSVAHELSVVAGNSARILAELPDSPPRAGDEIVVKAVVQDSSGNTVTDTTLRAALGGVGAHVTRDDAGFTVSARVPNVLPASRELALELSTGKATQSVSLSVRALEPVTAEIRPGFRGRDVRVRIAVRDKYGNLAEKGSFDVRVRGGTAGPLITSGDAFATTVSAAAAAETAFVSVHAGDRELGNGKVELDPPPGSFILGSYAGGGLGSNLGGPSGLRGGIGAGVMRAGRRLELAVFVGVEGLTTNEDSTVMLGGAPRDVSWSLVALCVPLTIRGRYAVSPRFGVAAGFAAVPGRASISVDADFQQSDRYAESVFGTRGLGAVDVRVGPGRIVGGLSYGHARLDDGLIVGNYEGIAVFAHYEMWVAKLWR